MTPNKTKIKLTTLKTVKLLNKKAMTITFGGSLSKDIESTGRDSQARYRIALERQYVTNTFLYKAVLPIQIIA